MARPARVVLHGSLHHVNQRGNRRQDVFFRMMTTIIIFISSKSGAEKNKWRSEPTALCPIMSIWSLNPMINQICVKRLVKPIDNAQAWSTKEKIGKDNCGKAVLLHFLWTRNGCWGLRHTLNWNLSERVWCNNRGTIAGAVFTHTWREKTLNRLNSLTNCWN